METDEAGETDHAYADADDGTDKNPSVSAIHDISGDNTHELHGEK